MLSIATCRMWDPKSKISIIMDSHTANIDIGLTHIALPVLDIDRSIEFYAKYAGMQIVHRRIDAETGVSVVWLSDSRSERLRQRTRPFVIVLIQKDEVNTKYRAIALSAFGGRLQKSLSYGRSL
jgi:predicted enzyme related to lactoylglutathione lyase